MEKKETGELFVSFPCRQNSKGEYKDVCFPMEKTLREDINICVLSEFEKL